jgi:hypothetical protein
MARVAVPESGDDCRAAGADEGRPPLVFSVAVG